MVSVRPSCLLSDVRVVCLRWCECSLVIECSRSHVLHLPHADVYDARHRPACFSRRSATFCSIGFCTQFMDRSLGILRSVPQKVIQPGPRSGRRNDQGCTRIPLGASNSPSLQRQCARTSQVSRPHQPRACPRAQGGRRVRYLFRQHRLEREHDYPRLAGIRCDPSLKHERSN